MYTVHCTQCNKLTVGTLSYLVVLLRDELEGLEVELGLGEGLPLHRHLVDVGGHRPNLGLERGERLLHRVHLVVQGVDQLLLPGVPHVSPLGEGNPAGQDLRGEGGQLPGGAGLAGPGGSHLGYGKKAYNKDFKCTGPNRVPDTFLFSFLSVYMKCSNLQNIWK